MFNYDELCDYLENTYGAHIIHEEDEESNGLNVVMGFDCPDCGEPVYFEDWENWNWSTCPVCGFNFEENE